MNAKLSANIGDAILKSLGHMSTVPVDFLMSKIFKYFITLSVVNRHVKDYIHEDFFLTVISKSFLT